MSTFLDYVDKRTAVHYDLQAKQSVGTGGPAKLHRNFLLVRKVGNPGNPEYFCLT